MRVMYIQPAEGFGGAERQGILHMKGLAALGHEVFPVVGPGDPIRRALKREGLNIYYFFEDMLYEIERPLSVVGRTVNSKNLFEGWLHMQNHLSRLAQELQVDLVFASRTVGWIVASPVAHRLDLPLIWRGGSRPTSHYQKFWLGVLSRLWRPDLLICNCEAVWSQLDPIVQSPSLIIPNGVDTTRFDPRRVEPTFRQQLQLDSTIPIIGFAGRPAPEKGLELLAQVIQKTLQHISPLHVLIAGEYGWRVYYEQMFRNLGLGTKQVTFLGHVEEIEQFYASCEVIVLLSPEHSIEGAPNAVLEAMAMQRPVLATRVGGLAELIEHGQQGFLLSPDNADACTDYLIQLLKNEVLRKSMGRQGRATVLNKFNDCSTAQQLSDVMTALVTSHRHLRALDPKVIAWSESFIHQILGPAPPPNFNFYTDHAG